MLADVALTTAQVEAVGHRDGPLIVVGGAGTGKTCVIEERFRRLVQRGCRPERVAVLTPSAARCDVLRERLEGSVASGYEELFVLTPIQLAAVVLGGWSRCSTPETVW